MQHSAQRVGIFVDVQNMYYSARALYEQRVDFAEILQEAVGDRQLVRALAYVIEADKDEEQSFFNALEQRGYELRSKEILNFYGGNQKGDWDIGIAIDIIAMADKLDVVVLVSGDGDFAPLMEFIKRRGCRAEVMAFGSSASSQLREAADAVFDLSQDTKRFLIPKKRGVDRPQRRNTQRASAAEVAEAQIAENKAKATRVEKKEKQSSSPIKKVVPARGARSQRRMTTRSKSSKPVTRKTANARRVSTTKKPTVKRTPRITH